MSIAKFLLSAIVAVVAFAAAPAPAPAAEDDRVRQCMRQCIQKEGPDHRAECRQRCAPGDGKAADCRQVHQACKARCEDDAQAQCMKACPAISRGCQADCRRAASKCLRDCGAERPECAERPGGEGRDRDERGRRGRY